MYVCIYSVEKTELREKREKAERDVGRELMESEGTYQLLNLKTKCLLVLNVD